MPVARGSCQWCQREGDFGFEKKKGCVKETGVLRTDAAPAHLISNLQTMMALVLNFSYSSPWL